MFETLKKDYFACQKKKLVFSLILIYRIGNRTKYSGIPRIIKGVLLIGLKIIQKIYSDIVFKVEIPFDTKIGAGLRINHPQGIIISEFSVIGRNCTIFHQVTIGMNEHNRIKNNGAPQIGDNVYIGCGAKIIGGIIIGDNVRIGANAIVTKDVPSNYTVIGNNVQICIS